MNKTLTLTLSGIVIVVFLGLAVVYFTHSANHLPHWLPGYSASDTKTHVKHGLAALIVAAGAALYAYFQTGPKSASTHEQK